MWLSTCCVENALNLREFLEGKDCELIVTDDKDHDDSGAILQQMAPDWCSTTVIMSNHAASRWRTCMPILPAFDKMASTWCDQRHLCCRAGEAPG